MPYEVVVQAIADFDGNPVERALTNRIVLLDVDASTLVSGDLLRKG
jgi:hypothetical protein